MADEVRVSYAGVYIELVPGSMPAGDPGFDIPGGNIRKGQAGKQTDFGTSTNPTFDLPYVYSYADGTEDHVPQWDLGRWTDTVIVKPVADFATFDLVGSAFFEVMPVLLNAGLDELTPSGVGPYSYDGSISQTAVGSPIPYTFRFGSTGTGNAVQIQDGYLQSMSLSSRVTDPWVRSESKWFGRYVDDGSGSGYSYASSTLPPNLGFIKGLLTSLELKDAGTTGGSFTGMTALDCSVTEWALEIHTGILPKWAGDENQLTFCGVEFEQPTITFTPIIRTNATNYAILWVKANARVHQELQFTLHGTSSRQWIIQMTGRWLPGFVAHSRDNNEVVMKPVFMVETPHDQTTTPHYFGWQLDTQWEHS